MKNFLKSSTLCALALVSLTAFSAGAQKRDDRVPVDGRTRDDRLISAKAGGVNFVAGDVKVRHAGGQDWQGVTVKDDLKDGDSARTGADGRVEVLLNPGSYLRAGSSTEFELTDASLDNLRLRVTRGSVFVEATGYDSLGISIQISTPQTRVEIVRAGVYRIDVAQSGETVVAVQKGRALVGDGAAALVVKGGKEARVAGAGGVEVAKLQKKDKNQRDELELWSRERGKELAKVNGALANRQTNTMLASYNGLLDTFRADFPNSYGFWMWSARRNCYTFLPFYTGWRSPYGFGYGSSFYYSDYYNCPGCPSRIYRPVIVNNANPPYTGTTSTPNTGGMPPASGGGSTGTTIGGAGARGNGGMGSPAPSAPPASERPAVDRPVGPRQRDQQP
jgi:hypothetical protein